MSYEPTVWSSGDIVTAAKLNKLENGLADGLSDVKSEISDLTPTIITIKDNIFSTNGYIRESTKEHYNASTYRHTNPIAIKNGQTVVAYLSATRVQLVIAAYTSSTISAANYISGVKGKLIGALDRYEYTATQDCYVVFSTQYTSDFANACAFVYDNYNDGEKILWLNASRAANSAISGNQVIYALLRWGETINSSGVISFKAADVITNKILLIGRTHISVHSWGCNYLSVCYYNKSGTFLERNEFTYENISSETYDFFVNLKVRILHF